MACQPAGVDARSAADVQDDSGGCWQIPFEKLLGAGAFEKSVPLRETWDLDACPLVVGDDL
jgi:hypothetical protein